MRSSGERLAGEVGEVWGLRLGCETSPQLRLPAGGKVRKRQRHLHPLHVAFLALSRRVATDPPTRRRSSSVLAREAASLVSFLVLAEIRSRMILGRGGFLKQRREPAGTSAPVGQPPQPARTAMESRSCLARETDSRNSKHMAENCKSASITRKTRILFPINIWRMLGTRPCSIMHLRMTSGWNALRAHESLRRALVLLLAEHELNASTFAARVAASTAALLSAGLTAGLSASIGPLRGGASAGVRTLPESAEQIGAADAICNWIACGHPLATSGDSSARADGRLGASAKRAVPPDPRCHSSYGAHGKFMAIAHVLPRPSEITSATRRYQAPLRFSTKELDVPIQLAREPLNCCVRW